MTETIAVIIPCYNHSRYLKDSIDSIINQSYNNLDIVIVNDGSSPEETKEIEKIISEATLKDKRVRYISYPKNKGKWYALNVGIDSTKANIVTSHDADDISLKQRIERQYKCLVQTNTIHNLCGFYHCFNPEDIDLHKDKTFDKPVALIDSQTVTAMVMQGHRTPGINHYYTGNFETAGVSSMFRKLIWDLGLRFNPGKSGLRVKMSEDSDFNFRVTALLRNTSILAEQIYCYRRGTSTNHEEK